MRYRAATEAELKQMGTAIEAAKEERKQLCASRPDMCELRLKLDSKMSPENPLTWSYEMRPPYRIDFDMGWGRLRQAMKRKWLGIEYYAEVIGPLSDQVDRGEVSERDAWLIARMAQEQALDMIRQQVQAEYKAARAQDAESWQAASAALLATAVSGLNAYTAAKTRIQPPAPSVVIAPTVVAPARPTPATGRCTYGLWALGGRSLCAMSDGSVTAR
jgi:hypothetical protein